MIAVILVEGVSPVKRIALSFQDGRDAVEQGKKVDGWHC
jgi:hypothetical protein